MKNKILIIEDNFCKFFTIKQVIEAQLKLKIKADQSSSVEKILDIAKDYSPDSIVYCPNGGVIDLLNKMKKKGVNRRNTEITLLLADETDWYKHNKLQHTFDAFVAKAA